MFILKYANGAFVGEDSASGGYCYPTMNIASAVFFDAKGIASKHLTTLIRQFPNSKFDEVIYQISVSPV